MRGDTDAAGGEKRGEVFCELEALDNCIEELRSAIDLAEKRIAPILRREPATKKDEPKPQAGLVPLAEEIRRQRAMVSVAVEKLRLMLSQIEL